jgi:FAD:protein FMN transferase
VVAVSRWDAFGTWCEVLTVGEDDLPAIADLARTQAMTVDEACSPSSGSEWATLVRGRPQRVSPVLAGVVAAAARAAELRADVSLLSRWRAVVIDEASRTLTLPADAVLDLGGTARAWAADWIATSCHEAYGVGCLVNLGGDIAVRGDVPPGGWQVEIQDGPGVGQPNPVISMGWPGGLATAAARSRVGTKDPPPGYWRSVTVAARSCERARAAGTAALAMADDAPRWLTQRELPGRLVHIGGMVVQTNGWPAQRWVA